MNVLSLFDGISCGRVALERAGIRVNKYYASEIDKYAIQVSKNNYPDIIHLGDVDNWKDWRIGNIDLIIGGSPCQGFSFAGKGLAFDDPRSRLFFTMMDIINHYNPKFRLLENVKMKQQHLDVITDKMGVEPVMIDSALVSAQTRKRYYWCNWRNGQPSDKGLLLKDIIEYGVVDREKSFCIDANYSKGGNPQQYFDRHRRQLVFAGAIRGRYNPDGTTSQRLEISGHEKANSITTVQKDSGISYRGVAGQALWRKLTPIECERLQTLPDNYTNHVSNTQRYKMLGNGWTVDVVTHLFKNLKREGLAPCK